MNKIKLIAFLVVAVFCLGSCSQTKKQVESRPNILLIMTDDMGYSDLGCYGGEIETPNIDKLASSGVRFTEMHNCARCCPTRASLLTGQYPHRVGIDGMGVNLNMNAATIAEVLKENGYHTGMTGKWHLSETKPLDNPENQLQWLANRKDFGPFSPLENYPCNRGFEEHWGVIWGVVNFFNPFSLVHNETPIKEIGDDFYMTNFITNKSIDLIDEYSKDDKPFFLYVAHTAPHWPLHALPNDIAKYKSRYSEGWETIRKERYERMVELNIIDRETYPLPENSSGKKWDDCVEKEKEAACMAVHAAMIDCVDQGIGKIIQKLKETDQFNNTIIFILSDNGASYERGYPPGFDRPGYTQDSTIINYNSDNPGAETTWNYLGDAWASASNTPFRYWKMQSYEGGTATPFIVHWPAGLTGKENTINRGFTHVIDILPTCLELAKTKYPDRINNEKTEFLDGKSLLPVLLGNSKTTHDTIFWEHQRGRAIRIGDWKMSALPNKKWELFNLAEDHTETNDLSDIYPGKVNQFNTAWEEWARELNIKQ